MSSSGVDNPAFTEAPGALNEPDTQVVKRGSRSSSVTAVELEDLPKKADDDATDASDEEDEEGGRNVCSIVGDAFENFWKSLGKLIAEHHYGVKATVLIILGLAYNGFFVGAVVYNTSNNIPIDFCDGLGFLIILTIIAYVGLFYFQIVKKFWGKAIYKKCLKPLQQNVDKLWQYRVTRYIVYLAILAGVIAFLVVDTASNRSRLISALGLVVFILLGWVFSAHPSKVIWRQVLWGTALQFVFGLIVLRWDVGRDVFQCVGDKVTAFLDYTKAGSGFVYGYLVTDVNSSNVVLGTVFAFQVLSVIYFFSFSISILYYYGVMQWLVVKIGWLLQVSVGTTAAESMNAAANIFLGQTEAPLLIKPYLPLMTKSELHAVMTGGFATIAGSVLAAYISFGISASHLLSASVMSAPAALAYSKLFYPESEKSKTKASDIKTEKGQEANALDAAAQGASNAVFLILNIIANLIAFLAFVAFLNGILSWFFGLVGAPEVTFEYIMSKIFIPVAWLMGVDWEECEYVASLVALKTIVNEFAAYSKLSEFVSKGLLSKRAEAISTYALCGFSNPGSIGCQLAALATLAPNRQSDLAKVAFRAFVAGSIACFMTACIAGTLTSEPGFSSMTTTVSPTTISFMPNVTAMILK